MYSLIDELKKVLYGKKCVRVLYEDSNNRIFEDFYKRIDNGTQASIQIDKKRYILGDSFKFTKKGIPYYRVKEDTNKTISWNNVDKEKNSLTSQELDDLVQSKIFLDVMKMTKGFDLDMKTLLIIGAVIIVIWIVASKMFGA